MGKISLSNRQHPKSQAVCKNFPALSCIKKGQLLVQGLYEASLQQFMAQKVTLTLGSDLDS